ncbi:MAG TPA: DUF4097 family beta strand repeat-containing protein, partial [Pyrinomonadaceae bacterium]|nr:DUF4097 family beta strand repeat-containing protein [Pyrinomonadaceae bacterium]
PPSWTGRDTYERSIAVDKNVTINLCVTQGTLKVTGWSRNEVRVFVKDGMKTRFNVTQAGPHGDSPVWIKIVGMEAKGKYGPQVDCISGDEIEIDAPVGSTVNMNGKEATTTIDGVKKVEVKTFGGDISLRNIANGITATTGQGDISVDESTGSIGLGTTTGNILVFDAGPSEIGDGFKARTNGGTISLQSLRHRQIDVSSTSGSVFYDGEILSGGTYSLSTVRGSIKMSIPANSSCQIVAWYGYGNFSSDLPLKIETEDKYEGPTKRTIGKLGEGGASVKLTSNNGSILIKKR